MGEASVKAAEAVGYRSAGTLEYLVSGEDFYFLEMNTRIQVEHTVTEAVTGVDLVREQIRIAAGQPMSITQDSIAPRGHSFECRINAEDAENRFLPTPAAITAYREPAGPGIRVDSGVQAGSVIAEIYDPMVAKLIVWDVDREAARRRMLRALSEYVVEGPSTLIPFHRWLFEHPGFIGGGACHDELAKIADEPTSLGGVQPGAPAEDGAEPQELATRTFVAEVDGRRFEVRLQYPAAEGGNHAGPNPGKKKTKRSGPGSGSAAAADPNAIASPMQGTVLRVEVAAGDTVEAGQVVAIVEAMKMENEVSAHRAGTIADVAIEAGQSVDADAVLIILRPEA
jgi:acetyl-CoA/propionyl-CoA carboxylase biotin carboxyl carrier protein